jgi:hypothetical protein
MVPPQGAATDGQTPLSAPLSKGEPELGLLIQPEDTRVTIDAVKSQAASFIRHLTAEQR